MRLRIYYTSHIVWLLEQLRRIALKFSSLFLEDFDLTLQTYLLWNITRQASFRVVLRHFEKDRGGTSESALFVATILLGLDVSLIDVKVHWYHLGASWAAGSWKGRICLYATFNFCATEWIRYLGGVKFVLIYLVNSNLLGTRLLLRFTERVSYFISGWFVDHGKGLHILVHASPDGCIDHSCLLEWLLILDISPLYWYSNLCENMGYIVSTQVSLCLELLRLETDTSVVLWFLAHLEIGLDCTADQRKRKGRLFSRVCISEIHEVLVMSYRRSYRSVRFEQVNWRTHTGVHEIFELQVGNQRGSHAPHRSQNRR